MFEALNLVFASTMKTELIYNNLATPLMGRQKTLLTLESQQYI